MTSVTIGLDLAQGVALENLQALAHSFSQIEYEGYDTTVTARGGNSGAVRVQLVLQDQNTDRRVGLAYSYTPQELQDMDERNIINTTKTVADAVARAINTDVRHSYTKHPMRNKDFAAGMLPESTEHIEGSGSPGTTIGYGQIV